MVQAALLLADAQGIDALSMRKLAKELGCEAMSLYNLVANKEDLLDAMVEVVFSEMEAPAPGAEWKSALRKRAVSAHCVLLRHPWATLLVVSRVNVGPSALRYLDATLGCLRAAGFSYELADRAWNALDSHVFGFTLQELKFPFAPEEYAEAAASYLPQLSSSTHPYLHELTRLVSEGRHRGVQDFEFGLELLLEGFEALRARAEP